MADRSIHPAPLPSQHAAGPIGPPPAIADQADAHQAAHLYLSLGWSPIPLCDPHHADGLPAGHACAEGRQGKVPLGKWRQYCHQLPSRAEVDAWWKRWPSANVGIAFGPASGLFGIDIDGPEGAELLAQLLDGDPPETLEFHTPGGGRRLLYKAPEGIPVPVKHHATKGRALSLLGAGSQTVMPPSLHRTGRRYVWPQAGGPAAVEVAVASPELVDRLVRGVDRRRPTGGGGRGASGPGGASRSPLERARAYCETCPGAVQGNGGDYQTWRVAKGLVRLGCLTPDEVMYALTHYYNPKCEPAWSERELQHKVDEAIKRFGSSHSENRSSPPCSTGKAARPQPTPPAPVAGGAPPARPATARPGRGPAAAADRQERAAGANQPSIGERSGGDAKRTKRVGNPGRRRGPAAPSPAPAPDQAAPDQAAKNDRPSRVYTPSVGNPAPPDQAGEQPPIPGVNAAELVEEPVSYLLDPWVPRATLTLVTGEREVGKSHFLAFLMSKARRTVMLPGCEEPIRQTLPRRLKAAGVEARNVQLLTESDWVFPLKREKLADAVRRLGADLVTLDPASSYLPEGGSEDCNQMVRYFLESLAWVAEQTGAAVVAVHHPGKGPGNMVRGAMNWQAVPRTVLRLHIDAGPPRRQILSSAKSSLAAKPTPRLYDLASQPSGGMRFVLLDQVDDRLTPYVEESPLQAKRRKIDEAMDLLRQLLARDEQPMTWVLRAGEAHGIPSWALKDAREALNVPTRKEGFGKEAQQFWGPIRPA